ncbi:Uncharacterised protein [Providencia rustigianii]|uniref:Uncharacterized protein n=7 Tax=Enterobacterales TaxID=91347 RepID=A0A7L8KC94_ECOLX|nr:hypothetical protein [Escherichia coli]UCK65696.1 hypothetical protein [Providencia rettgeri]SPY66709.1 Uncharacterised protein [Providencia stuartii]SUC33798.1 Uncharacterised protein [Providencia rustigianii]BAB93852.1 hypothetical protein [Proteus vulgaris]
MYLRYVSGLMGYDAGFHPDQKQVVLSDLLQPESAVSSCQLQVRGVMGNPKAIAPMAHSPSKERTSGNSGNYPAGFADCAYQLADYRCDQATDP